MHDQPRHIETLPGSVWPERLIDLAHRWYEPLVPADRERLRSEVWVLLVGVLELRIRHQATGRPDCDADRCYDLAVERALDLMRRFAGNRWDPRDFEPAQLQRYFTLLARNTVIDYTRSRLGKTRALETTVAEVDPGLHRTGPDDAKLECRELAAEVADCATRLAPRARLVWFLRVFCDLPSRRIGRHPAVEMSPGAVDMAVSRSRRAVGECLHTKGVAPRDFVPGTFTACWEVLQDLLGGAGDPPRKGVRDDRPNP